MKALILAGGFAKRLWPLTTDKAKPLLPIAGKAVISHIVEKIPREVPIIVSTNSTFSRDFFEWKKDFPERDISIFVEDAISNETKKGALAAIGLAIGEYRIDEDLLVIGGDNIFTFDIVDFINTRSGQPSLAVFDIEDRQEARKFGVVIADGRKVQSFQEKPDNPLSTLIGTCCYYFPHDYLSHILAAAEIMPDKLGGVFEYFLQKNIESHIYPFSGYWNDIGSFRAYIEAHVQVGSGLAVPEKFLDEECGNIFEGVNYIDESCDIKASHIKDSIVLPDSVLRGCFIDTCVVDHGSELYSERKKEEIVTHKVMQK